MLVVVNEEQPHDENYLEEILQLRGLRSHEVIVLTPHLTKLTNTGKRSDPSSTTALMMRTSQSESEFVKGGGNASTSDGSHWTAKSGATL